MYICASVWMNNLYHPHPWPETMAKLMWSIQRVSTCSLFLDFYILNNINTNESRYKFTEYKEGRKKEYFIFLIVRGNKKKTRHYTTSASILASITVDGAYFAAYPYIRAKAACISSESSVLKSSEKKDKNLQ